MTNSFTYWQYCPYSLLPCIPDPQIVSPLSSLSGHIRYLIHTSYTPPPPHGHTLTRPRVSGVTTRPATRLTIIPTRLPLIINKKFWKNTSIQFISIRVCVCVLDFIIWLGRINTNPPGDQTVTQWRLHVCLIVHCHGPIPKVKVIIDDIYCNKWHFKWHFFNIILLTTISDTLIDF